MTTAAIMSAKASNRMNKFVSFPKEVFDNIGSNLDKYDIYDLRQTCTDVQEKSVTSFAISSFKTLKVKISNDPLDDFRSVQYFLKFADIAREVKKVKIIHSGSRFSERYFYRITLQEMLAKLPKNLEIEIETCDRRPVTSTALCVGPSEFLTVLSESDKNVTSIQIRNTCLTNDQLDQVLRKYKPKLQRLELQEVMVLGGSVHGMLQSFGGESNLRYLHVRGNRSSADPSTPPLYSMSRITKNIKRFKDEEEKSYMFEHYTLDGITAWWIGIKAVEVGLKTVFK